MNNKTNIFQIALGFNSQKGLKWMVFLLIFDYVFIPTNS